MSEHQKHQDAEPDEDMPDGTLGLLDVCELLGRIVKSLDRIADELKARRPLSALEAYGRGPAREQPSEGAATKEAP